VVAATAGRHVGASGMLRHLLLEPASELYGPGYYCVEGMDLMAAP
jgi:hypothetical protein